MSRAIAVADSLIEFERTESPKVRHRGRSGDEDSGSSDDEAEGKPTQRVDKSEKAAKEKGRTYERKPKGCFFCDGPHRASECLVRNRLAAIVRAEEESERECSDGERHQEEPGRLGALRVRDGHHGEQPKSVMRLGALRSCQESSRVEEERTETVAKGSHEASVEAQPDPSRKSAQGATRRKRKTRRQRKSKGPTSAGARRSQPEHREGS